MTMYAEDVNFWKTGKSSPDVWIDRAKKQITELGGQILGEGFGSDVHGKSAFMLAFKVKDDAYKIVWPVLPSYREDGKAARIQAATMLYHYVKSTCLYAVVVGAKTAFFSHFMLPDGRMASQVATDELTALSPPMLLLREKGIEIE